MIGRLVTTFATGGVAIVLALAVPALAACGHPHDAYESFQACFDEHTIEESLSVENSITVCALDHAIEGEDLDFATAAECVAYMDANLTDASASADEIMAGCDDYIVQQGQ